MQRGLEIPVQVAAEILEKYEQFVVSNYKETGIDGNLDDCEKEELKGLENDDSKTDEEVQSKQIVKIDC